MNKIEPSDKSYKIVSTSISRICRSHKAWNKCFGIGCNKTATSSLNSIFSSIFGFQASQGKLEINSTMQMISGNYRPFIESMHGIDFHQDLPISQGDYYVALDALFPQSKFILTLRDPDQWIRSFMKQYQDRLKRLLFRTNSKKHSYLFPGYSSFWLQYFWDEAISLERCQMSDDFYRKYADGEMSFQSYEFSDEFLAFCTNQYVERNERILRYFSRRPDDLLVVDMGSLHDISIIRDFLGLPDVFSASVPHKNSSVLGKSSENLSSLYVSEELLPPSHAC